CARSPARNSSMDYW
nr:immunoglobulin heavy chain junction region [Mus musculus]